MALKLGKCRLCLKLGDFYSIFTVDNSLQLAEMAMNCARIKIYEGDGLPDKVCSECIQKLSSAFIFKQQCERADEELRKNYIPPPGFSITPPPSQIRQSSDSAFSNHTDLSNQTKPSSEEKVTPSKRPRKRSGESFSNASVSSLHGNSFKPNTSQKKTEISKPIKRARQASESDSFNDDTSFQNYEPDSDSDEPVLKENQCNICRKEFGSTKALKVHRKRIHNKTDQSYNELFKKDQSLNNDQSLSEKQPTFAPNTVVDIPKKVTDIDEDKVSCDKCGKSFKLKIMLKRHSDTCTGPVPPTTPKRELLVSLKHIDLESNDSGISCTMCPTRFKTYDNLEKHLRVCHAAVINKSTLNVPSRKSPVPCLFCQTPFEDYYVYVKHHYECTKKQDLTSYTCLVCNKEMAKKVNYLKHVKNMHFEPRELKQIEGQFECRKCNKKLASQDALITHLAAHMSNIDDADDTESRASTADEGASSQSFSTSTPHSSNPFKCRYCDKNFVYRKSLLSHELKHTQTQSPQSQTSQPQLVVKNEFETSYEPVTSTNNEADYYTESDESSQNDGDDNTCDICDQMFSYKRLLIKHKKTKHNSGSGLKRAKIQLKDCLVKCLICDIDNMKVNESLEHNKIHIKSNIKPRNRYTCIQCQKFFKSCSSLQNHIKIVHRMNCAPEVGQNEEMPNLADFCEVVVTKTEPLDENEVQSHNDSATVPKKAKKRTYSMTKPKVGEDARVDLSGFSCHLCGKKMQTLISLKRHVNWHTNVGNKVESILECFVCQEKFRFKGHYRLHMRSHYHDTNLDPKFLTCNICGRKSKHLRAAQAHNNYHKQTRFQAHDFKCSICNRVFQARKVYLSHMAIHYKRGEGVSNVVVGSVRAATAEFVPDGSNTCPHCDKKCDNPTSLKHHMSWHKSKGSLYGARHQCEVCNMTFTNKKRMELHIREHYEDDNGEYKCGVCGKGYTDPDYMKKHQMGHNFDNQSHKDRIAKLRANKVKCPICSRYYPDLVKLIRHLRLTHPESKMIKEDPDAPAPKVYPCKLCAKTFFNEHNFKKHEEAHLRKPLHFRCKLCLKKFNSHKNHNIHIKGHMTKKYIDNPLKCEHCDEHFIRGYDLHYHLRDVHGINETWITEVTNQAPKGPLKEFQCSICHKILASRGNYERHLDYHNSLRCNYCHDYFSSLKFLEGHLAFSCDKKKLIGDTEPYTRKIKCELCYKAFHLQVKLDCHLRTQHGQHVFNRVTESKKETVCDYCFKLFENEAACAGHKVYHRTIYYFGCIYCDRKFNTISLFNRHKNDHYARLNVDDPYKCDHCDETFVPFREYIYHMRDEHGDDKDWLIKPKDDVEQQCHICHKTFFNLHKHLQYHEDNRCKKCSEYFFSQLDFEEHLCDVDSDDETQEVQTDTRPKYEECTFCFKPITKTSSKLKHDLIHKASGSISCRFCSLKFKTMDAFNIHAFSHRNRKYNKKPIKCKMCGERFLKYGPFIKHLRGVHKYKLKMHYRAIVKPERCVVCGEYYPNLHNHYRAHLLNRCQKCFKYFTSAKVFGLHECDKEDSDPTKVFTSDENLTQLINTYVPKDDCGDDNKLYGFENGDDENEAMIEEKSQDSMDIVETQSQNSVDAEPEMVLEPLIPHSIQSPIISDVLSLYQEKKITEEPSDVIDLSDDDVNVVYNDDGDTVISID